MKVFQLASSSRESASQPRGNVVSGQHFSHFPKDRNYDICMSGEGCEYRNNHRYAVVVQDLATLWIQSCPCKTKTSQETEKSLQKFLEPTRKPRVFYTDNSLEFGNSCDESSWILWTSTPHRSEINGIAERTVRRIKEGTSAVLLRSSLDENWWADSMECHCYLRNIPAHLSGEKTPYERRFGEPFKRPVILVPWSNVALFLPKTCRDCFSSVRKSYQEYSSVTYYARREFGKEMILSQTVRNWKRWTHQLRSHFGSSHFLFDRALGQ